VGVSGGLGVRVGAAGSSGRAGWHGAAAPKLLPRVGNDVVPATGGPPRPHQASLCLLQLGHSPDLVVEPHRATEQPVTLCESTWVLVGSG